MLKIGDRVRVQFHIGTIIDPDDPLFASREVLKRRPGEYYCVKFDGPGPYGDGIGVYHRDSLWIIKLPVQK
jgi:hypothetical protein